MNHHFAHQARWQGRNGDKDQLRAEVWEFLERDGWNVGPVWSRIPNFVGADMAALHLSRQDFWREAKIVKCNPDPPQIPVRLRALVDGKILYMPIPELVQGLPFVELSPVRLAAANISFELAATSQGAVKYGTPIDFDEMPMLDLVIVGCVAVTKQGARIGKGGGFADLELGIFREMRKLHALTPIITTVHSTQIVDDARIVMLPHDSPLDWIFTELDAHQTLTPYSQPQGVAWDQVQPDQFSGIPFLQQLRTRIERDQQREV